MTSKRSLEDISASTEDIAKAFELLPQLFAQRQKELDEQENAIKKERKALEEERELFGATKGNNYDVLKLNVGGKRIDVLRMTLTSVENSMLASRFSGRWDNTLVKDEDGNFFIDQPLEIFQPLIDFLRSRSSEVPGQDPQLPPSAATFGNNQDKFTHFLRMTEYYGMTHGLYRFNIVQIAPPELQEEENVPSNYIPGVDMVAKTHRFFYLTPSCNRVRVKAFEVRLGSGVSFFQVGWINGNATRNSSTPPWLSQLGDAVALDALHSQTHVRASYSSGISGRTIGTAEGTTIWCNRLNYTFQFQGDEALIYPSNYTNATSYSTVSDYHVPAICGTGSWQITKVILDCSFCIKRSHLRPC